MSTKNHMKNRIIAHSDCAIPTRKAGESIIHLTVKNKDGHVIRPAFIHIDQHGCYNLYSSLLGLLLKITENDTSKLVESFRGKKDCINYLEKFYLEKYQYHGNPMKNIKIFVRGGVVQSVQGLKDDQYEIIDYDNLESGSCPRLECQADISEAGDDICPECNFLFN